MIGQRGRIFRPLYIYLKVLLNSMNLICNTCASAHLYADNNLKFPNPFIWNTIIAEDYLKIVKEYDSIDFSNISVKENHSSHRTDAQYLISFDNKVNIYLPHHIKSASYPTLTKKPNGRTMKIYYKDMEKYILETYSRRAGRMTEEPVFFVDYRSDGYREWTDDDVKNFISMSTPYQKVVCVNDKKWLEYDSPRCKVLFKETPRKDTKESACIAWDMFFKDYKPSVLTFLVVAYENQKLTEHCIMSINKSNPNSEIYVVDNSVNHPFKNRFSNVTLIDNTNGKFLNFNRPWKYPKIKCGSDKHCSTIAAFMDKYDKNFIHVDSDAIVKRDLHAIWKEDMLFVGEIKTPKSYPSLISLERALPFVCFINTKLAKENGIKYYDFNDKYIFYPKPKVKKVYDTGAYFLEQVKAKKLPYEEIKFNDFISHLGAGSYKQNIPARDEWLRKNKKYWDNAPICNNDGKRKTKVIYTVITGKYDMLRSPDYIDPSFDYVCLTNNHSLTSNFWEIRYIDDVVEKYGEKKGSRYPKINAHLFFPNYEESIYIDANIVIKKSMSKFMQENFHEGKIISISKHPRRIGCLYEEKNAVIRCHKDTLANIEPQIDRYKAEGFPKNYGLSENNIIIRKHNDERCVKLVETWWNEVENGSHRDQLSFMYALWKTDSMDNFEYFKEIGRKSPYFQFVNHKTFVSYKPSVKQETLKSASSVVIPHTGSRPARISNVKIDEHAVSFRPKPKKRQF